MFNVPLHSRSAIEAHRTRWRVESAQCLRSSHSLTMHPKKHAFSGTPPKLVGALIRRHKPYTKGIARVYEWRESAIGYRTASPIGRRRAAIGYRREGEGYLEIGISKCKTANRGRGTAVPEIPE